MEGRFPELVRFLFLFGNMKWCSSISTIPPFMTSTQTETWDKVQSYALGASTNATSAVLARLDSPDFRLDLSAYAAPSIAEASARQLLENLREAAAIAELVHGFPSSLHAPHAYSPAADLPLLSGAGYLPNMWQLVKSFGQAETSNYYQFLMYLGPCAVTENLGWGLPDFSGSVPVDVPNGSESDSNLPWPGGYPASLDEASDRAVYTALNLNRLDMPTELYGDVALVLNRSLLDAAAVLSPMDSGDFSISCDRSNWTQDFCALWGTNVSACNSFWYCGMVENTEGDREGDGVLGHNAAECGRNDTILAGRNCSVLSGSLLRGMGVPGALDHLFLPFADYFGPNTAPSRLASLVARALTPWSGAPGNAPSPVSAAPPAAAAADSTQASEARRELEDGNTAPLHNQSLDDGFFYYMEANILASAPLPAAATFLLASFTKLFGSAEGERVVAFAAKERLPLAWAFGAGLERGEMYPPAGTSWAANRRLWDPRLPYTTSTFNLTKEVSFQVEGEGKKGGRSSSNDGDQKWDRVRAFQDAWRAVAQERAAATVAANGKVQRHSSPAIFGVATFNEWWSTVEAAVGPGLLFEPLLPGSCSDIHGCVGLVKGTGSCICRRN